LRPVIRFIVLPLVIACSLPVSLAAQEGDDLEDEFEFLQEDEVVFTASKHEQEISDSPSTITVITRSEIENTHCSDITCLLRQVPELEIRRKAPMDHSVGARALASEMGDKVLVLIDGLEANFEMFGMPFWAILPVHLQEIERIEIVRGPGSALYGANAHSLVVSISTRKDESDLAEIFVGGGEHFETDLHLMLNQWVGDWRLNLAGEYATAGAHQTQDRQEKEKLRFALKIDRKWTDSVSSLDLNFSKIDGKLYTSLAPTKLRDGYFSHAQLAHQSEWLSAHIWINMVKAEVSFDFPLQFGPTKMGSLPNWLSVLTLSADGYLQLNWSPFEDNLLIGGVNYRWLSLEFESNDPELVHQHRIGVFIQDEQKLWDQLILVGGLRLDWNSITPLTFSPRLATVWRYTKSQSVRVAFGRAFRKPSFLNTSIHLTSVRAEPGFEALQGFFQRSIGNEDLGNESNTTIEAGYRGRFLEGSLTIESDVFFNMYRDTIAFDYTIEYEAGLPNLLNSSFRFENEGMKVNSIGGSLSLVYQIKDSLRLSANYTYRYSYYVSESLNEDLYSKGDRVPWEPAHLFNASGTFFFKNGLRCGAAVYVRSAFNEPWKSDGGLFSDMIMVSNEATAIVGAFAAWRFKSGTDWIEAGLRAYNLLNTGFRDLTSVTRFDGVEMGGQLMGRSIIVFVRGGI
jgi:outer membrane receptor for ferrienterochelin and colicin